MGICGSKDNQAEQFLQLPSPKSISFYFYYFKAEKLNSYYQTKRFLKLIQARDRNHTTGIRVVEGNMVLRPIDKQEVLRKHRKSTKLEVVKWILMPLTLEGLCMKWKGANSILQT